MALTATLGAAANLGLYLLAGATGTELRAPMGQGGGIVDLPVLPVPIVSVVGVATAAVALRVAQRLLPGQEFLLTELWERSPRSPSDLAHSCSVEPPTVTAWSGGSRPRAW